MKRYKTSVTYKMELTYEFETDNDPYDGHDATMTAERLEFSVTAEPNPDDQRDLGDSGVRLTGFSVDSVELVDNSVVVMTEEVV